MKHLRPSLLLVTLLGACAPSADVPAPAVGQVRVVNLGPPYDPAFEELRAAFVAANPGYDVDVHYNVSKLDPLPTQRVVFVLQGVGITAGAGGQYRGLEVGDLVLLRADTTLLVDNKPTLVAFSVPEPFPEGLPTFVQPEMDPLVTNTPGGCATEEGAYRRILLTWKEEVGPYVYHGLNAHLVRITDSFTHYHPVEGGFDELYLVLGATAEARVLTSEHVDWIEKPGAVTRERASELLTSRPLRHGDLVYMPRGTLHRGLGGMVVQVVSVPGFVPNAEIGVDQHLARINAELGLEGADALPLHAPAADAAVVK